MKHVREKKLGWYIAHLYRKGLSTISKELQEFGIGSGQYAFLLQLYRKDGISQEELSTLLSVDKATVARAIKKLEEEQLVYRIRDENDKRYYQVFVTEKALSIKDDVFCRVNIWEDMLKQNLTKEEEAHMLYLLQKMTTNVMKGENN